MRALFRGIALLSLSLLASGCAALPCPEQNGRAWLHLENDHFSLKTDLYKDDAVAALYSLELYRQALGGLLEVEDLPPVEAVVFRDWRWLENFGMDNVGFASKGPPLFLVAFAVPDWYPSEAQVHELVHSLLFHGIPHAPHWLHEGLASFLETLILVDGGKRALVGQEDAGRMGHLRWNRPPVPLAELFAWSRGKERDEETVHTYYATAHLLVRVAWTLEGERFQSFLRRLAAGKPGTAAWSEAFPPEKQAELEAAMKRALKESNWLRPRRVDLKPIKFRYSQRPLSPAEFHLMAATIWQSAEHLTEQERLARRMVEWGKAARHEPDNGTVRRIWAETAPNVERRAALAREATRVDPENPWGWHLLAKALPTGPERSQALEHAAKYVGAKALVHNAVAWEYVLDADGEKALPLAQAAVAKEPANSYYLDTLAAAQALTGRCAEATETQTRAIARLPPDSSLDLLADLAWRKLMYEQGCQQQPPVQRGR